MRFLLDTHIAYWLVAERENLSVSEYHLLVDPINELSISTVSVWELRIKWNTFYRSGDRKGPIDPLKVIASIHKLGLSIEPLIAEHAAASLHMPIPHCDPFDDLLLTIAQETGRKLFTRDRKLRDHPLAFLAE